MSSRTKSRPLSFKKLARDGESGAIVVKLMMACNDIQTANESLEEWKADQPFAKRHRQLGALLYFIRLQFAHLYEALKVIQSIKADGHLMAIVAACDQDTQASFNNLMQFLPGGSRRPMVEQMMGRMRSNLVFHYDESGKEVARAIKRIAEKGDYNAMVTRGNAAHLWHFETADMVIDRIVVRDHWKIPPEADVRAEADKAADQIHEILLRFADFAGEFLWRYASK